MAKLQHMDDPLDAPRPVKREWRWPWRFSPVLVLSVVLHLLFIGGAAIWVVSRYNAGRKLTFQAGPKSPNPSEQALQHKVQVAKKSEMKTVPAVPKRILSTGVSQVALPPMPEMPKDKTAANPATMAAASSGVSFAANAPMGAGNVGGTGSGAPINFFGIRDTSSSVVIMIDVSDSMFTRTGDVEDRKLVKLGPQQNFQVVRDEAIKLLKSLGPNVQFGIVRWSGGAYSWKPELVPATEENKQAAINHIQSEVDYKTAKPKRGQQGGGGTRHDLALGEAFALKPEVIYMLTDGNATMAQPGGGLAPIPDNELYAAADAGQKTLKKRARLHSIYYITGADKMEERLMLTNLASRNGGQFRQVTAKSSR